MIYSSCVYLIKDDMWLMLYRNQKEDDMNAGKYIGVGGKQENGETIEECAIREVKEETGLDVHALQLAGTVLFHSPIHQECMYVYITNDFSGSIHQCDEGQLQYIHTNKILQLPLWQGDILFLKRILHNQLPFHYIYFYDENDNLIHYEERNAQ